MSIPIRLAADIGGTFTDVVLESEAGFQSTKVLTTLNQPEIGVMQGIDELLRLSNIEPGQITHAIHGTTLGTNTVIERKGAKTAFLTTEGFRDILEMGYEKRFDHYDIYLEKPPPLVPRKYRLPVRKNQCRGQGPCRIGSKSGSADDSIFKAGRNRSGSSRFSPRLCASGP